MRRLTIVWLLLLSRMVSADSGGTKYEDKRLDQAITLSVINVKLEEVAELLSEKTGIEITAGTNSKDWRVKERLITIHAKETAVGSLIQQIAGLLDFRISQSGKTDEWTYVIWQDLKARNAEEERVDQEAREKERLDFESRQAAFDIAQEALKLAPQDALKRRDESPELAYLGGTAQGRALASLLSGLSPAQMNNVLQGQRVMIPLSSLSAAMQRAAAACTAGPIGELLRAPSSDSLRPSYLLIAPTSELSVPDEIGVASVLMVCGTGPDHQGVDDIGGGVPMSGWFLGQSHFSKTIASMLIAMEEGMEVDEAVEKFDPENSSTEQEPSSATEKNPPTDSELTRDVELHLTPRKKSVSGSPTADDAGDATAAISAAIQMPVLLESFVKMNNIGTHLRSGKQPLYNILIGLEKAGYIWTLENRALRVRPKDWAEMRSYVIPDSFIAYYRYLLETQGEFLLEDIAAAAFALTDKQIEESLLNHEITSMMRIGYADDVRERVPVLRLYHALSSRQKKALTSESGLLLAHLTDQQWNLLSPLLAGRFGTMEIADGSMRLLPQDVESSRPHASFCFSVHLAGENEARCFDVSFYLVGREEIAERLRDIKVREAQREQQQEEDAEK